MPARRTLVGTAGWLLGLVLAFPAAGLEPARLVAGFPRGHAVLETAGGRCLLIDIHVAITPDQRAQGLMFVEEMGEFEGMYFGYDPPASLAMWMKNTILPLDMLFILPDGTVGRIVRNAEPYSTARIESGGPVSGVLELNAGFAERWKLGAGTKVVLLP